jgi:hypothetical protein
MDPNKWVMSCENPTYVKYAAHRLWKLGIRSGDRHTIISVCGYSAHDADILCAALSRMQEIADREAREYNPELGF